MTDSETFSTEEARRIGEEIGIDWSSAPLMSSSSAWGWMSSWNTVSAIC